MKTPEEKIAASAFAGEEFLTRDELCELLKISKQVLYKMERNNEGPPRVRIGRSVRYPRKFLDKYLAERVQANTEK